MNRTLNSRYLLTDEVSLEGLDGITLQALWVRISQATGTNLPFPEALLKEYWNILQNITDFSFYQLPEPRPDFVPFNRFINDDIPDDIYKHKLINDVVKGVKGSCPTYFQRIDVTNEARQTEFNDAVKKWGNSLVVVASQELREYALMGTEISNYTALTPMQFCVLERIGRARYQGEITLGKRSLQLLGEDPKSLFYHRKTLLKFKLITKQVYNQKSGTHNSSGTLLHLTRFYTEKKSKMLSLTEQVVEILRNKPNYRALYSEIFQEINYHRSFNKLSKTPEFHRFIQTDVKVPYREYYPNSDKSQWKLKNGDKEKTVRVHQLIDPDVDVAEQWNKLAADEEDSNDSGFGDYSNLNYGMALLPQAAKVIQSRGENGTYQSELCQLMGINRLSARSFSRNLLRRNVVTCFLNDVGRQRIHRFVSRKYDTKGKMTVQLKQEQEKMFNLLKTNQNISSPESDEPKQIDISQNPIEVLDKSSEIIKEDLNSSVEERIIEEPVKKKMKLDINKRVLDDVTDPDEPEAKKMKTGLEIKKNLENVEVQLVVTKSCPGIKGSKEGFLEQFRNDLTNNLDRSKVSYRILKRANFIIETIREMKVIVDMVKLIKLLQEKEKDEGYNAKIDKKSIIRLVLKLAKEGYVKYIKVTLVCGEKTLSISFICDPNIDENNAIIQSAIEQAKMKIQMINARSIIRLESAETPRPSKEAKESVKDVKYIYDRSAARQYGFCPKFIRLRRMHEVIFFLVHHKFVQPLKTKEEYKDWLDQMKILHDDQLISEMSPVYHKNELSWKTFIPPVADYSELPQGWLLICDILLRMPLQIFVKCFSCVYRIDELEYYLNHPVRKNFLVKNLPIKIQNALMHRRRHVFQMHSICSRLCYCGLLQFGPQKLKEKDQIFVYLNRKTSILNTSTSNEGYHEISEKEYNKHVYYFKYFRDIEQYWYDLWSTCMNTALGGRLCVNGKYIILEQLEAKQAMIEAVEPRTAEEAERRDNGEVPGNHKGAAGLDSALFAHLQRNWRWDHNNDINYTNKNLTASQSSEKVKIQNTNLEFSVKKSSFEPRKNKPRKVTSDKQLSQPQKKIKVQKKPIIRKVIPKKNTRIRRPFYDEVDKLALQKMAKLRTDWTPLEDHILLLCLIGSKYLCPNRYRQIISFSVIRDVLHRLVKYSTSKTSRACQRRINYIMRNSNTLRSVQMCLEEIKQSENCTKRYEDICKRIFTSHVPETEMNIAFIELVSYMTSMFSELIEPCKKLTIPSSVQQFKEKFRICGDYKKPSHYEKPENVNDITLTVIRTVIHSSMCSSKDKTSWAYQLFKIYQQYPENILRSAITKTRKEQMISLKKTYMRRHKTKSSNMPLNSSPYQLSITYKHQLHKKLPYSIFKEAFELISNSVSELNQGYEISSPINGSAIALMELTEKMNLVYRFEIPDEILILDKNIQKDKTYERLIKKYYTFLQDPERAEVEEEEEEAALQTGDEDNFPNLDLVEKKTSETEKKSDNLVVRSYSSRLAFYMMRAEICEGMDDKSSQHMHDFFVVNACKVFISLPSSEENIRPEYIHEEYLSIKLDVIPQILSEIKYNAVIPEECATTEEFLELIESLPHANSFDKIFAQILVEHIWSCGIFGATTTEILNLQPKSYKGYLSIVEILDILVDLKIVIESGVEQVRFIHFEHKKPWIINSYKILRLNKEKMPVVSQKTTEKMNDKLFTKKTNFSLFELQKSKQRLDLNSQQMVKILISPWIRIDGTLNRRVLDRWMGAILITCLQNPGICLENLHQTFTFLRPVELSNCIKYLCKLKCVRLFLIQKTKTTLFSSIPTTTIVAACGLEAPKDIFIEPLNDATTKFAVFIGNKNYDADFISA